MPEICTCGLRAGTIEDRICGLDCPKSRAPETPGGCVHAFEPRYDEYMVGSVCKKVYVRDVCRRCGAVVERADSPAAISASPPPRCPPPSLSY